MNAISRSRAGLALLVALSFVWSGCTATDDATGPLEAPGVNEAKPDHAGGGGGKKDKTSDGLTLEEFFVYEDAGVSHVHLVFSGTPDVAKVGAALDHGGDGIAGGLEASGSGAGVITDALTTLEDGRGHVDVAMDPAIFFDSPYFQLDGSVSDPWVFRVGGDNLDDNVINVGSTPDGVIINGQVQGTVYSGPATVHGEVTDMRSWAQIAGTATVRGETWVGAITIDTDAATCSRTVIGKGKNRSSATQIDVPVSFTFGMNVDDGVMDDGFWARVALQVNGGELVRASGSSSSFTFRATVDGEPSGVPVRALVENVTPEFAFNEGLADLGEPQRDGYGLVYNPLANGVSTVQSGDLATPFSVITSTGSGQDPVALSGYVTIPCS